MSPSQPSLLDYLSFRLDRLSDMTKSAASALYEREFGIGVRDLRVLRLVALEPGLTLTRLIALTLLEKSVTSKCVTALAQRGLLRRQIGEQDARQVNLYLTPTGIEMIELTYRRGDVLEQMLLDTLTETERKTLNQCIEKLVVALIAHKSGGER
ncbi:MarR family winged helix-turn-helix transcriptional regulator [Cupriavidus basilensis]|uniref:Transcriptional regulator, MarR family n=1 Tax=Cupriavidus basilensis TaxID=68895 RepID=A0A0C4YKF3_9BURK|nr:MarR family transcriptional regulator [Cupriavidus basilensis]AJG23548.1 Transcriptional regulator, MarR family [Cupriavidus basilensis]